MKKLKRIKLIPNVEFMSEDEMKMILGGYDAGGGFVYSGNKDCIGKKEGDPCNHPTREVGICRYWPFTVGLVCYGSGESKN